MIRDSTGHPLCNYSGLIKCIDSNGAEVFAVLMGWWELRKLDGYNAIIEGDSFSVIQWGSG